ncbi:MAG TPA: DNA double-strand break repair nuclease NurA [Methanofastidiosum sp.]|nr:DNA double-strand break repair nuclease NurA [Methanofastidiosum sp.]HQK62265.1 DNA double-strand break repair nuclease NurA [Methanofastidiosum sp.]
MNIEIIKDILNQIKSEETYNVDILDDEEPQFSDYRYNSYPLKNDNVKKFIHSNKDSRICYIDGGNIDLISSPSFYLGLVRVYFNMFRNNKVITPNVISQKYEFYVLGKSLGKDRDINFTFKLFPFVNDNRINTNEVDLTFDSKDPSISNQNFRAQLNSVCGIARRFLEWKVSEVIIDEELDKGDILVRDGSLQTAIKGESDFSKRAYAAADKKEVTFCGVAKSSRLYTNKGRSLSYAIRLIGNKSYPNDMWYYHPIVDINYLDHNAEMYFVKFHPSSRYVFRFEIQKNRVKILGEEGIKEVLGLIASNSMDLRFPGYPFGLVDSDYIARVRNDEKETHTALFRSLCDDEKIIKFINENTSVEDAHGVLDSLQGI